MDHSSEPFSTTYSTSGHTSILATMSYTIRLRVENSTSDALTVVEKTCWYYANGCTWTENDGQHVLFMGGSGTSGMLRFKSSFGEIFTIVVGIHNYKLWCGLLWDLGDQDTALKLHPEFYRGGKYSHATPDACYSPVTHATRASITFERENQNEFPWRQDGTPAIGLVLSPWFTHGWTALELAMSNKV
ncbi:hypothetical protein DTO012A8_2209 [Penicillium roqueforti]|nr:hypothetical protein DTO012A8_2209 [Penicillium roqueforti]